MSDYFSSGALNVWSGTIPRNIPYRESYYIRDTDGSYMDLTDLTIAIYFRETLGADPVLTLTTTASTIVKETLTDDAGNSIPTFRPAAVDVSDLEGDHYGDIVMTDGSSVKHYWASGKITFAPFPAEV